MATSLNRAGEGPDSRIRAAEEFALQTIMRPIPVVPGSREVEEVLADFKAGALAVVLDEYSGTAGVTMEDLLEESSARYSTNMTSGTGHATAPTRTC